MSADARRKPVGSAGGGEGAALSDLMRQMDTPPGESPFTPIAPRSWRTLLSAGAGHSEKDRVLAWHWWRTTDVDPRGRTGPKKLHRTAYPHDERGELSPTRYIPNDLGIAQPNVTRAINALLEEGTLARDEKGRTYPTGNAPQPRRKGSENIKGEDEAKQANGYICTDIKIVQFSLYLQRHNFSGHDNAMARINAIRETRQKAAADAAALLREWEREEQSRLFAQYGFEAEGSAVGRPKLKRQPIVQVTFLETPPISVQKSNDSVQIRSENFVQNEKISEENGFPAPILITSDTEKTLYETAEGARAPFLVVSPSESLKQERAPNPSNQLNRQNQNSPGWPGILLAMRSVQMAAPDGLLNELQGIYEELPLSEREAALDGILQRRACGQYDPQNTRWTPAARRYLKERLWTEPLRIEAKPAKSEMDIYLDKLMAEGSKTHGE